MQHSAILSKSLGLLCIFCATSVKQSKAFDALPAYNNVTPKLYINS